MKKVIAVLLTVVLCLSLAACANSVPQEQHDTVVSERDSASSALDKANSMIESTTSALESAQADLEEKESQISDQEKKLEELDSLYQKYKDLSDAEVSAQTEANNKKAEEDRLATEKLLAEEAEQAAAEEKAKIEAAEAEAKKGYDTGITYENLARTPDDYEGKKVKFTGEVIQVMEADGEIQLRVATRNSYEDVVLVYYDGSIVSSRVLEDDTITIFGTSKGLYTYQSTMGGAITIPLILVEKIEQ